MTVLITSVAVSIELWVPRLELTHITAKHGYSATIRAGGVPEFGSRGTVGMSTSDKFSSAGVGMLSRYVAPAGFLSALELQRPRGLVTPAVMLVVLVISLVGLWRTAGLTQAMAGFPTELARSNVITGVDNAPALWPEAAPG